MKVGTLCYIESDHKVLMLYRNKKDKDVHEGKWVGLGGKVEAGESPEECVIREVKEESGLDIESPKLRGIMTFPDFGGHDWYVFLYTADSYKGNLAPCNEGSLKWIDQDKLFDLNLWDGDRLFLKWLQEDEEIFSAKFVYDNDTLVTYSKSTH